MAVFNVCVQAVSTSKTFHNTIDLKSTENSLFNRFVSIGDCTPDHYVIHNKCNEWARYSDASISKEKSCVRVHGGVVTLHRCDDI